MKKLLMILFACMAMACGDNADRSTDREAAAEEDVEIGSGEEISPQLELDSAGDSRFEVDTISSSDESEGQSDEELKNKR